jgi:hypothetical protein
VVVSRTLQRVVLARAVIVGRARPRRMRHTAQIRRHPARFLDWEPPPLVSERGAAGRTQRFPAAHRRPAARRHWRYLMFVPVVVAALAALLFRVM